MHPLNNPLPVLGIYLAAVASPGPNIIILTQNTLGISRKAGLLTALGFACGAAVYVSLGFVGVISFIEETHWLLEALTLAGGAYIIYIGFRLLWSSVRRKPIDNELEITPGPLISNSPFLSGLVTMLTNPKAGLPIIGLFTVIDPKGSQAILWIFAIGVPLFTLSWHSSMAILISKQVFRNTYSRFTRFFDPILGGALIVIGLKIMFPFS